MKIFDSMVIIHLTKLGKLRNKCEFFGEVVIPTAVKEELLFDVNKYPDAIIIEKLINEGKIKIQDPDPALVEELKIFQLHGGELEAFALTLSNPDSFLYSNDPKFRNMAPLFNIKIIDTMALLVSEYKVKLESKEETLNTLNLLKKISKYAESYINGIIKLVETGFFD